MEKKQKHWVWNILIGLTTIVCILAFTLHYKNWVVTGKDHVKIMSGFYYQKIRFSDFNTVTMVKRIPSMQRINGFSAMHREKGVFKDSILDTKVFVYVDDLKRRKIKLVHHDSLQLFLNFADTVKTREMFDLLSLKIKENVTDIED